MTNNQQHVVLNFTPTIIIGGLISIKLKRLGWLFSLVLLSLFSTQSLADRIYPPAEGYSWGSGLVTDASAVGNDICALAVINRNWVGPAQAIELKRKSLY